jgi:hypothetical protein
MNKVKKGYINKLRYIFLFGVIAFGLIAIVSSGGGGGSFFGGGGSCPEPTLDIALCNPATATFSNPTSITNEFFPLAAGTELILEGEEDGKTIRLEITVDGTTETVSGVETLMMVETEYEDDEKIEVSYNYMAQADDGTVCYFGEDVDIYEDDVVVSHEGAWRAGVNGALPGIMMPADPQVGDVFYQEYAEDVAEDMGSVIAFGESVTVPAGTYTDTLTMEDCNPLEDAETGEKIYVRNIGLVVDEEAELQP